MFVKVNFRKSPNYENVCDAFLMQHGFTLGEYSGRCHVLAYDTIKWMKHLGLRAEPRWVQPVEECAPLVTTEWSQMRGAASLWSFHCVVYYQREVHDPWFGRPLGVRAYTPLMFERQKVSWRKNSCDPWYETLAEINSKLKGMYECNPSL